MRPLATAWRIPLPAPEGGTQQRGLPELGCGPGECPDKGSWPRDWSCGSAANHFKPGHWMSLPAPKQVFGVVHRGKPDVKERNFHYFCVKNIPCAIKNAKKKRFGICLVLGHHHPPSRRKLFPLSIPFALLGREGSACPA